MATRKAAGSAKNLTDSNALENQESSQYRGRGKIIACVKLSCINTLKQLYLNSNQLIMAKGNFSQKKETKKPKKDKAAK